MEQEDRRFRKTRKALVEALVELMKTSRLNEVTVKDLCDKADIHRATFYYHYSDIFDFYEQEERHFLQDVSEIVDIDETHTYQKTFGKLMEYIEDNLSVCSMFYARGETRQKLSAILREQYVKVWQYEEGKKDVPRELPLLADYHIQGSLAVISSWLESGMELPREKLAAMLKELDDGFDAALIKSLDAV